MLSSISTRHTTHIYAISQYSHSFIYSAVRKNAFLNEHHTQRDLPKFLLNITQIDQTQQICDIVVFASYLSIPANNLASK